MLTIPLFSFWMILITGTTGFLLMVGLKERAQKKTAVAPAYIQRNYLT
jgi:hypothetical protein